MMFDNIQEAVAYIESKRHKRTVDEFRKTLESLKINMRQKNMVHIAGTNGKGSTVNYLRSILNAHGYHIGTFTSPYLVCHNDRIRIDDEPISDEDLLAEINKFYDVIEKEDMSMFEIDVMIMLDYFDHHELDYRIIECGIGGLNDKTNVIDPIITAITNIGMDHLDQIGPSLFDIINEKMGIIKPHQVFVTSETKGTILARFQEQCDVMGATMIVVPEYQVSRFPFHFRYRDMAITLSDQALYQIPNARLALTIANKLITLNNDLTIQAIEHAKWAGRFEIIPYKGHEICIDGAHNAPGIEALVKTLQYQKKTDVAIVFSCLKDKNRDDMIDILLGAGYHVYVTSFADERVTDMKTLKSVGHLKVIDNYPEAIKVAMLKHKDVVVTGSLHFVSRVRAYLTEGK